MSYLCFPACNIITHIKENEGGLESINLDFMSSEHFTFFSINTNLEGVTNYYETIPNSDLNLASGN